MKNSQIISNLVCPKCKSALKYLTINQDRWLNCYCCRLSFPIVAGIPILLVNEAKPLHPDQNGDS